ncbi:lipopolysaccharide biosynthesis protein [Actinokineospora guangxiensis]|uniref:Lipopolysaccharide biosynthesis protein n=1 Tax=Actinokineospora guangxiensis TaxID=1490288 RepID=A0ABW0EGU5_9PSEU
MGLPGQARSTPSGHLARAVVALGGGQLAAQAVTAAVLVALGRDDPAAMGAAAAWYGIAVAAAVLVDAGASTRVLRDSGGARVAPADLVAVAVLKPAALLAAAAVLALVWDGPLPALVAAYAALRSVGLVAQSGWLGRGQDLRAAAAIVTERCVAAPVAVAASALGARPEVALCLGLVVGAAVVAATAAGPVAAAARGAGRARWRSAAGYGRRFVGAGVAGTLVPLDVVIVVTVAGEHQAGLYAVGARLLGPLVVLVTAAGTALLPAVAAGNPRAPRLLRAVGATTLAALAGLWLAAGVLVPLLAGAGLAEAVPAVRWHIGVTAVVAIAQLIVVRLLAAGRERLVSALLPAGVLAGLGAVAAAAALVPDAAAVAGAIGYGIAALLVTAVLARAAHGGRAQGERAQGQREGDGDVSSGGVAQRGEQHVPDGHQQQVRLGQGAPAHGPGQPAGEQRQGQQPERHGEQARRRP